MDIIWTALSICALYIAIMSIPSKHFGSSPYPAWLQNVAYHLRRIDRLFRANAARLAIAVCLAAPFLITPAQNLRIVSTQDATIAVVATTMAGAFASAFLFWKKHKSVSWLRNMSFPLEVLIAVISFLFFHIGSAIADEEIQRLLAINPEELSTAGSMLAGLFALWFWFIFFSIVLGVFSVVSMFTMLAAAFRADNGSVRALVWPAQIASFGKRGPDARDEDEIVLSWRKKTSDSEVADEAVMVAGLSAASLFLASILASDWLIEELRATIAVVVLSTSFFTPAENVKKCMESGYTSIRIVADGDRAVLSDGKRFKVVPCEPNRQPPHRERAP
jgi:hypothetical protein